MKLKQLEGRFGVARLPADCNLPDWVHPKTSFCSITHTENELSIVLQQELIPENIDCEKGMTCIKIIGPLDFSQTGILSQLASPLAKAEIPIFTIATYETDYIFIHERFIESACEILLNEGHEFV